MADTKISALTALTGANVDPAADVLPIVDTSTTTTKKILIDELVIGLLASTTSRMKAVTFTRDVTTASGTQAVTGVGFSPKQIIFLVANAAGSDSRASWGFDDGTLSYCIFANAGGTIGAYRANASFSIYLNTSEGATDYTGEVTVLGADGFTVTWTKTGSPTGTYTMFALCFR